MNDPLKMVHRSTKLEAESIEIPINVLKFNEGDYTGFVDAFKIIYVRGNVLPDTDGTSVRDRMSSRAVLAHEYYGHYKSHPSKYKVGDWRDEYNASRNAAINTPNLTEQERADLMVDAYDRAKEAGVDLQFDDIARRIIYGF